MQFENIVTASIGPVQIKAFLLAAAANAPSNRLDFDSAVRALEKQFAVYAGQTFSHFEPDPVVVAETIVTTPNVVRVEVMFGKEGIAITRPT